MTTPKPKPEDLTDVGRTSADMLTEVRHEQTVGELRSLRMELARLCNLIIDLRDDLKDSLRLVQAAAEAPPKSKGGTLDLRLSKATLYRALATLAVAAAAAFGGSQLSQVTTPAPKATHAPVQPRHPSPTPEHAGP